MKSDRKAAISAYKERKIEAGIYAIRCAISGETWVGSAPDVSTIQNRQWFTLRQGGNTARTMQKAWNEHGAEAFTFEVLETLQDDEMALSRDRRLKELRTDWANELGATPC